MLVKELRNKTNNELLQLINNLKAELFMLRFQNKTGQLDKPHKIVQIKKDIAKVFTIINARELNIEQQIITQRAKTPVQPLPEKAKLETKKVTHESNTKERE